MHILKFCSSKKCNNTKAKKVIAILFYLNEKKKITLGKKCNKYNSSFGASECCFLCIVFQKADTRTREGAPVTRVII